MTFRFEAGLTAELQVSAHNGFFLERQPEDPDSGFKTQACPLFQPRTRCVISI